MDVNSRHNWLCPLLLWVATGCLLLSTQTIAAQSQNPEAPNSQTQNSDFLDKESEGGLAFHRLEIIFEAPEGKTEKDFRKIRFEEKLAGPQEANAQIDTALKQLWHLGYLTAYVDKVERGRDTTIAKLTTGPLTEWLYLKQGNVDQQLLKAANFRERDWENEPFHYLEFIALQDRLLRVAADRGFPFASVGLDSVSLNETGISGRLNFEQNELIIYDSVFVLGTARIAPAYLETYLGIQGGQPYNESAVRKINTRIEELPFLRQTKPAEIRFYGDRASIGLFLEPVNANKFDLLLGVLPNSEITGRLTLTGEGRLDLQNALGAGERIKLDYRQLIVGTREFKAGLEYPYLPVLPFGANLNFSLYIRDTTFLDRVFDAGLQYTFQGNNFFRVFYTNKRTSLLEVDTAEIRSTRSLPDVLDVSTNQYGLAYNYQRLDYRYNPRKGFSVELKGSVGSRKVLPNTGITSLTATDFDFATLYDSVEGNQDAYQAEIAFDYFQPVTGQQVLRLGVRSSLLNSSVLYENERYRIGGNRLLRGFDEESIFATSYTVLTIEYRLLLSRNSFTYLFWDGAYLEDRSLGSQITDRPFGFGAGLNFETRAGIFGISYALGRQLGNPIEFRAAKLHFGYINYF